MVDVSSQQSNQSPAISGAQFGLTVSPVFGLPQAPAVAQTEKIVQGVLLALLIVGGLVVFARKRKG